MFVIFAFVCGHICCVCPVEMAHTRKAPTPSCARWALKYHTTTENPPRTHLYFRLISLALLAIIRIRYRIGCLQSHLFFLPKFQLRKNVVIFKNSIKKILSFMSRNGIYVVCTVHPAYPIAILRTQMIYQWHTLRLIASGQCLAKG